MSKLISLCMIVRNEEANLPNTLKNLQGFWDELIVVDTGSTDNTVAIAKANDAKVLDYEWQVPGHKSEARNAGIDAATGKWIVVLDADELIEEPAELRAWLTDAKEHAAHVQFFNVEPSGAVSLIWNQMRIFRRGMFRYKYREHEIPVPLFDGLSEAVTDAKFIHRQPEGSQPSKIDPMLQRLILDVQENPDDPHPVYFLHRQYMHAGEWNKAIEWGTHYLKIAGTDKDKCETYGNLAMCHEQRGESYPALQFLHRALADQPNRRIWWVRIAELYASAGQYNTAMGYLRAALEIWKQPEQHYQPTTELRAYQLIEQCQRAIAHGGHSH